MPSKTVTRVNDLTIKGEHFVVVEIQGFYGAINKKDINPDGTLKRKLNGLQMHLSDTIPQLIDRMTDYLNIMEIKERENCTLEKASLKYYGFI